MKSNIFLTALIAAFFALPAFADQVATSETAAYSQVMVPTPTSNPIAATAPHSRQHFHGQTMRFGCQSSVELSSGNEASVQNTIDLIPASANKLELSNGNYEYTAQLIDDAAPEIKLSIQRGAVRAVSYLKEQSGATGEVNFEADMIRNGHKVRSSAHMFCEYY